MSIKLYHVSQSIMKCFIDTYFVTDWLILWICFHSRKVSRVHSESQSSFWRDRSVNDGTWRAVCALCTRVHGCIKSDNSHAVHSHENDVYNATEVTCLGHTYSTEPRPDNGINSVTSLTCACHTGEPTCRHTSDIAMRITHGHALYLLGSRARYRHINGACRVKSSMCIGHTSVTAMTTAHATDAVGSRALRVMSRVKCSHVNGACRVTGSTCFGSHVRQGYDDSAWRGYGHRVLGSNARCSHDNGAFKDTSKPCLCHSRNNSI